MKEKQNFNESHPEIKENEMFLMNCISGTDNYTPIGWKTKRKGFQAFCVSGEVLDGYYPVFVQKEEYEKGMKR